MTALSRLFAATDVVLARILREKAASAAQVVGEPALQEFRLGVFRTRGLEIRERRPQPGLDDIGI